MKILFVCTMAWCRSRTAVTLFDGKHGIEARCCGTDMIGAHTVVTQDLLDWAEIVVCMEQNNQRKIENNFVLSCPVHVLNIPDVYGYMQPELCHRLRVEFARVPAPARRKLPA